ncbi:hypothetical protein FWJ25_17890 [Marinobacter salinexigens]|uniref:Uncharacterized protein n=1 Tax=Marinobacter salinexigens TaxID=2919747 RepID=A0A5B0V8V7_9GAMM|nr:hypothetical protein FWJ25_17890 [Marinobacter salinexigens]
MTIFLVIFSLLIASFCGFLFWQVQEQKKLIATMMADDQLSDIEQDPELILTLKVRDPIALAKRESRSARMLADRLPVMVRKMVYQEVMKELEQELYDRDIDVEMRIEYR